MDLEERIQQLEKQKKILQDSIRKFQTNRNLNTMDEIAYRELEAENRKLKDKVRAAEGETSIVKGIGMNSPEMRAAIARLKDLEEINKQHQKLNGELREDNKKLARQVEDQLDRFRKAGAL